MRNTWNSEKHQSYPFGSARITSQACRFFFVNQCYTMMRNVSMTWTANMYGEGTTSEAEENRSYFTVLLVSKSPDQGIQIFFPSFACEWWALISYSILFRFMYALVHRYLAAPMWSTERQNESDSGENSGGHLLPTSSLHPPFPMNHQIICHRHARQNIVFQFTLSRRKAETSSLDTKSCTLSASLTRFRLRPLQCHMRNSVTMEFSYTYSSSCT